MTPPPDRRAWRDRVPLAWLAALAVLCVAAAAVVALWRLGTREKSTVDRFAVVEAVRKVLKVATVEMQIAEVVTYHDAKPLLYFFSSDKNAIFRVRGKVLAGLDLTAAPLDIRTDEAGRVIRIRLPRARVLAIDPSLEILDERSGWRNAVTREDRNLWLKWARGDLRRAALDSGITGKAEENARELLSTLTGAYGYRLEVSFVGAPEKLAEPPAVEDGPAPEPPGGRPTPGR